jgi:aconitate hydratase
MRKPPFFEIMGRARRQGHRGRARARGARRLGHHRPHLAGRQHRQEQPAAKYLASTASSPATSTQYGARRGNHEVMMRGTFANIRLKNLMLARHRGRRHASTSPTASR